MIATHTRAIKCARTDRDISIAFRPHEMASVVNLWQAVHEDELLTESEKVDSGL